MGTSHQHHPSLFPVNEFDSSVVFWAKIVSGLDEARGCFITSVTHWKCTNRKQHEFYVVHVLHPSALLRFDRSVKPSASQTVSLASSSNRPANDHVYASVNGTEHGLVKEFNPCQRLRILTFPDPALRPSLAQFSTLLLVASEHRYHLFKKACYWYADVAWEVLRQLYPDSTVSRAKGTLQPSTFRGISIRQRINLREVLSKYEAEWQEVSRRADQKVAQRRAEDEKIYKKGVEEGERRQQEKLRRYEMEIERLKQKD